MKWEKVKLGSLCERILSGGTPSTDIKEYWNGEIPWISSSDIKDHTSLLITKGISASLNPNILPAGNIIVVTRVGLGKVIGNDVDLAFSQDLQGLILKSNIHRQYLIYALLKEVARFKNISRGATIKGVTKEDLVNIEIPLPPLHIQHQIADTLDKADALRRKDQEMLKKYDELAEAIFYEMFGDPVRNEKKWNVGRLIDNVIMGGGGTPKTTIDRYYNGSIPWISPKDMKSIFISNSIDKITELAVAESSTKLVDPFCVLMVVRSGILKNTLPLAINTVAVTLNQDMKSLKCKDRLNPYFLIFQLKALSGKILTSVRGTTADNISSDVIKNIEIIMAPIEKQKAFETVVKNIYRQKVMLEEECNKSFNLFRKLETSFFS